MNFVIKFCMCAIIGFRNFEYSNIEAKKVINDIGKLIPFCCEHKIHTVHENATYLVQNISIPETSESVNPSSSFTYLGEKFTIIFDGEIYNKDELKKRLSSSKIKIKSDSSSELVLKCYALDKEKCLDYLNGVFAFCVYEKSKDKLFLARDQIGVKPLFYFYKKQQFAFASQIKFLFKLKNIVPKVDISGLQELFGIGPARTPGKTVYQDIKEVKPGEYIILENEKLLTRKYYKLKSKKHTDTVEETALKIRNRLSDIIKQQSTSGEDVGMFLSGGLDSSVITALSYQHQTKRLRTFSVDYKGNAENFVPTDFTPSRDNVFIDLVAEKFKVDHKYKLIDSPNLYNALHSALIARDVPAMADIDSSLLLFCKEVKKEIPICLSGEFADEIFCGYPWFYRTDTINSKTFPWSINISIRENTLAKKLKDKVNIKSYIEKIYSDAIASVPLNKDETEEDKMMKIYSYITINYFGLNLLERTERIGTQSGLKVRMPFIDVNLLQYVYNIPWSIKNYGGFEKGILRKAFEDVLPSKVAYRKKSPYPKTVDPVYTSLVEKRISELLAEEDNRLWEIIDIEFIAKVLNDKDSKTSRPWFGQLMNRPQYLAFIIQIEMWLKEYNIILAI